MMCGRTKWGWNIGWEKLREYDEVVMFIFTIMGPLYPFKTMFDEMSSRDVDFWGITRALWYGFRSMGDVQIRVCPHAHTELFHGDTIIDDQERGVSAVLGKYADDK